MVDLSNTIHFFMTTKTYAHTPRTLRNSTWVVWGNDGVMFEMRTKNIHNPLFAIAKKMRNWFLSDKTLSPPFLNK